MFYAFLNYLDFHFKMLIVIKFPEFNLSYSMSKKLIR